MSEASSKKRSAQARHAAAVRWRKPNQTETARDLAYAQIEEYIRDKVASSPPFTAEQGDRLSLLLRPAAGGAAA